MASFHDVRLDPGVSYGSRGGPSFKTIVSGLESGYEQRSASWDAPRRKWNIGHKLTDPAFLETLLSFFMARKGKLHGFRFKDWSDWFVGKTWVPGGPLTDSTPMQIGVGNGVQSAFQLTKTYTSGTESVVRKITRPVSGTVKIFVNGSLRTEATHYTVNYSTGVVTFTGGNIPANGHAVAWIGEFDIPARFNTDDMELDLEGLQHGRWPSIVVIELRE